MSLRSFIEAIVGSPAKREHDRLLIEIHRQVKYEADAYYYRRMADYYTGLVLSIDPNTDWWAFAQAKQKQYDHQQDCVLYEQRAREAEARVEARLSRLKRLSKEPQDSTTEPAPQPNLVL